MASQLNQDEVITQAYYLINNKGGRRAAGIRANFQNRPLPPEMFFVYIYFVFKIYSYQ